MNKGEQLRGAGRELPGLRLFVLQPSGIHTCVRGAVFPPGPHWCWEPDAGALRALKALGIPPPLWCVCVSVCVQV